MSALAAEAMDEEAMTTALAVLQAADGRVAAAKATTDVVSGFLELRAADPASWSAIARPALELLR